MDGTLKGLKVYIFYSSRTEPEILSVYQRYIDKLKEKNIDYEEIDIYESKEKAEKFNIEVTPSICIVIGGKLEKKFVGVAHMKEVLGESMLIRGEK